MGESTKQQKSVSRRGRERHRVTIPVLITVYEGNRYVEFRGEATDFSSTGLCLILTRQLEKAATISIEFNLPYNSQPTEVRGIVRHRSGFHHGIEFIGLTGYQKELLERTSRILGLLS